VEPKVHISTGSRAVNEILAGGVECGVITEFFGMAGSGKSKMATNVIVNSFLDVDNGGASADLVFYVDPSDNYDVYHLDRIADQSGVDGVMDKILLTRPTFRKMLWERLEAIERGAKSSKCGAVIIDDFAVIFDEKTWDDEQNDRTTLMFSFLHELAKIAEENGVSAIVIRDEVPGEVDFDEPVFDVACRDILYFFTDCDGTKYCRLVNQGSSVQLG
jgi:RecA/RadA recombinase